MQICALRLVVLLVSGPLTLAAFASGLAQPVASAKNFGEECGISIQLHMDTQMEKDAGAPPAICSLVEVPKIPSPFVNSLMVIPWSGLSSLKVNDQPLNEIGFYRLSPDRTARYSGRPSYDDPRTSYGQKVLSSSRTNLKKVATTTEIHRTDLRVKWLRPLDARQSEEVSQDYVCVDAASKDEQGVLLMNWCELRSKGERVVALQNAARTLTRKHAGHTGLPILKLPIPYQLVENRNLAGAHDQTNCLDINRKTTGDHLGVVCTSSSAEFLKDMGVIDVGTQAGTEPLSQEWGTGLVVATPMAQYKLVQSTWARPGTLSAEVDCDTAGESIYRSTATCRVTIARDGKGRLTYSSIVVQDHVKKKAGLPSGVERLLWRQLDSN